MQPRVPVWGNKASKPLIKKTMGVAAVGETPSLTGDFIGETHRVLVHRQTYLLRNQHQKGSICLPVVGVMTSSQLRVESWHCSLLDPFPTYSTTMQ